MGRKPTNKSYAQFGWPPGDPTHPSNPRMPNGRHDQFEWGETEPKSARRQPTQRHGRQSNMWHRNVANLNGPRTKQGYRVTGQTVKSYYILGLSVGTAFGHGRSSFTTFPKFSKKCKILDDFSNVPENQIFEAQTFAPKAFKHHQTPMPQGACTRTIRRKQLRKNRRLAIVFQRFRPFSK